VISATAPPPASGRAGLRTQTAYDRSLRPTNVVYPDGTSMASFYTPAGQLQKTYGIWTYPVQYTYDTQGRVKTMKVPPRGAG
jgi:hypothetical protein